MGTPLHIAHDRRRLNRSREGNFDLVVDRRSLLSTSDDLGSAEDLNETRSSRMSMRSQQPKWTSESDVLPGDTTRANLKVPSRMLKA
ncbi:MAG: hypothetical protein U0Q11_22305 [Vicinamibacterales bacterium]